MRTIGLTGGIGSGKSTVARILADLGAEIINADLVGHQVYEPGCAGWHSIVESFGAGVVGEDGHIDRKRLAAIVFADPRALARLNAIVHPLIAGAVQEQIAARRAAGSTQPIVVEAAVLIEANWTPLVDEVWVVTATPEAVIDRVHAERGLPPSQIAARVASQITDDERQRHAAVVIENTGSIEELRGRVEAAWGRHAHR